MNSSGKLEQRKDRFPNKNFKIGLLSATLAQPNTYKP